MTTPILAEPLIVHAVVLNWKDTEATLSCVSSLVASSSISRIWIIDNESDGSLSAHLHLSRAISLIELPENRGFAAGVNVGLQHALDTGAEALLVINNDAILGAGAVEMLEEELRGNPEIGVTAPRVSSSIIEEFGAQLTRFGKTSANTRMGERIDFLTWACVMVRATTLRRVGLLDESYFMYWEDVEFSRRVSQSGWRQSVVPAAQAIHATSSSHVRAGPVIAMYSVAALLTFAQSATPRLRAFCYLRAYARVLRAWLKLDFVTSRWLIRGLKLGRVKASPIYPLIPEFVGKQ